MRLTNGKKNLSFCSSWKCLLLIFRRTPHKIALVNLIMLIHRVLFLSGFVWIRHASIVSVTSRRSYHSRLVPANHQHGCFSSEFGWHQIRHWNCFGRTTWSASSSISWNGQWVSSSIWCGCDFISIYVLFSFLQNLSPESVLSTREGHVLKVLCVRWDMYAAIEILSVNIGYEACARKATSASSCTNMTWQRCRSAIFTPDLVSISKL